MRRGFTLLELMVAGAMATIVLGGITTCLSQLGTAKSVSRQRLDAFNRADAALRTLRRDVITVLRRDDLFDTRLLVNNDSGRWEGIEVQRDALLLFNGSLRANKEIDFNGEGIEYETQFRIEEDDVTAVLWKRRDPIVDDNPAGGGIATPLTEGIVSLMIEAYDGEQWLDQWDSDYDGIPHALRLSVAAAGTSRGEDTMSPLVMLRTVVPLDRVMPPADLFEDVEGEEDEDETGTGLGAGGEEGGSGDDAGPGSGGPSQDSDSGPDTITDPDGNVHEIPGTGGSKGSSGIGGTQ